jgi:starch synthase
MGLARAPSHCAREFVHSRTRVLASVGEPVNNLRMKILLAASELEPFTGAGEFAVAMRALSAELAARGHEVSVVLPYYRMVREGAGAKAKRTGVKFSMPVGGARYSCEIRELRAAGGVQVFFVERDELFDRSGLYGTEEGDYQDNAARFIFFSKCVVELARRMDPAPEVLHAHNWQAALAMVFAADQRVPVRRVLSAHSLVYQGNFWSYDFGLTNLPGEYFSPKGLEYYGSMNLLKAGMLYAESVVLPGPRYVSEAQTPSYSCGLDPVLRENAGKLEGISNGIDVSQWNPSSDKSLPKRYKTASGKSANQSAWLSRAGLTPGGLQLLLATDALTSDGMATLLPALDRICESGARLAVLGRVAPTSLAGMESARRRHAGQVAWLPDYDEATLRLALAGSDALLCPAPVAPDASTLLRGLRYGVLPICAACGGLESLAPAIQPGGNAGVTFPYYATTPEALVDAVRRATGLRRDASAWNAAVERAMAEDFSWPATAAATEALYASLLARRGTARAA